MKEGVCHICGAVNSVIPERSTNCGRCGHPIYPQNEFYNLKALKKIKADMLKKVGK